MLSNDLKRKIFIETYNTLKTLPKDKRNNIKVINRCLAENYVKLNEWDMARNIINTNQTINNAIGLYSSLSAGAKWLWKKIKGEPSLDQKTKAVIAQKMIAASQEKLAQKQVLTRDDLQSIINDTFAEKKEGKLSEVTDPNLINSFIQGLASPLQPTDEDLEIKSDDGFITAMLKANLQNKRRESAKKKNRWF